MALTPGHGSRFRGRGEFARAREGKSRGIGDV
jgi:hypothetical protein